MIIENGFIQIKRKAGGGIDTDTGMPIAPAVSFSKPIRCQWFANTFSWRGRTMQGGHFTQASYEILVELDENVDGEQLRLCDASGREVGQFSVISVEPMQAVGQYKILV